MYVESELSDSGEHRKYHVHGQVFFNSADEFILNFDFKEQVNEVTLNLKGAHFWDISAVASFDKIVLKFKKEGKAVNIIGLNEASQTIIDRFGLINDHREIDEILAAH